MSTVRIVSARLGAQKVRADKYIREVSGLPLGAAKAKIDAVLDGEVVSIELSDGFDPKHVAAKLEGLGFTAQIVV